MFSWIRSIFPLYSEEWCVVTSAFHPAGDPVVTKMPCRNGVPIGAGGFLWIWTFDSLQEAVDFASAITLVQKIQTED